MIKNPELQRNLWLEITLQRIIAMPAILGLIYFIFFIASSDYSSRLVSLLVISKIIFVILVLWGTRNASASIVNEINQKTWDFQKLSSISPWQMTIGKLLGSTLYTWYGAIIALAIYGVSLYLLYQYSLDDSKTTWSGWNFRKYENLTVAIIYYKVVTLFLGAILIQALAMFCAASALSNRKDKITNINTIGHMILSGGVGFFFFMTEQTLNGKRHYNVDWYNLDIDRGLFTVLSLAAFVFWVIVGIYRTIKKEFQYKIIPSAWFSFLLFVIIYQAGFFYKLPIIPMVFYSLVTLITIFYSLIFIEPKELTIYKKMKFCIKAKKWKGFLEVMPLWMVTYLLAIFVAIIISIISISPINLAEQTIWRGYNYKNMEIAKSPIYYAALAIVPILMMGRDILIIHFCNLCLNRKRADFTALIYIAILYFITPAILALSGFKTIANLFVPLPITRYVTGRSVPEFFLALTPAEAIIAALSQLLIMYLIFIRRMRKVNKESYI